MVADFKHETKKLTAEQALEKTFADGPWHNWSIAVIQLSAYGFTLIPTDPDSPKMIAAVEAGAIAMVNTGDNPFKIPPDDFDRLCVSNALIAVLEELKKP